MKIKTPIPTLLPALCIDEKNDDQLKADIERFPEISARIISLANSDWTAPSTRVSSLESAIEQLGPQVLRSVCVSIAVSEAFKPLRISAFDPCEYWCSAFLTADCAALLASYAHETDIASTPLRTAGLLHDVGLLWLIENFPDETAFALEAKALVDNISLNAVLRQATQTDIHEVGVRLRRTWRLPDAVVIDIESLDSGSTEWQTATLVKSAANMIAAFLKDQPCPERDERLQHSGISQKDQIEVFAKLGDKRENRRTLAQFLWAT
jgi:HD-like signal output (HDOD) protein